MMGRGEPWEVFERGAGRLWYEPGPGNFLRQQGKQQAELRARV